jgi:hypothetical protein
LFDFPAGAAFRRPRAREPRPCKSAIDTFLSVETKEKRSAKRGGFIGLHIITDQPSIEFIDFVDFICFEFFSVVCTSFAKSFILVPVKDNIFAMLSVEGQRGCPSFDHLLLLLNVVGSSPLFLASLEQDILWLRANFSIALHIFSCVIHHPFLYFCQPLAFEIMF